MTGLLIGQRGETQAADKRPRAIKQAEIKRNHKERRYSLSFWKSKATKVNEVLPKSSISSTSISSRTSISQSLTSPSSLSPSVTSPSVLSPTSPSLNRPSQSKPSITERTLNSNKEIPTTGLLKEKIELPFNIDMKNKTTEGIESHQEDANFLGNTSESQISGIYNRKELSYGQKKINRLRILDVKTIRKNRGKFETTTSSDIETSNISLESSHRIKDFGKESHKAERVKAEKPKSFQPKISNKRLRL